MNSLVNLIDINGTKITKEKDQIMNCSLEDMRQFSAKSIVEYIEYFNPNVLLAAFTSPISNVTYTIDGIKYNDTDRIAKYIDQLKTEEKEAIYDRFLDADVLYICFLDKNFVTNISSNKNLFNRIKNGLVAKICDNKYRYSNAIGDFMQYIRLRHDYDNKSRCMYINLALEVLESLNFDSLIEEIDKNGKKVTRFKDRGCENFLFYLLDIINISGIECLNLFAKKYVDNKSNLQKIIGFILKSDDSFITKDSCLGALFLIFPQMATTIYKPDLSEQDHDLYTQCLINFINSDKVVLSVLTNRNYKNEDEECVVKFLVDKIKCNKIKDAVSNLKDRKVIERVWRFIQKYYGNENGNNYLELVDKFANELIEKDKTSALISVPAIFFDKHKLDNTIKNLISETKDLGNIIKLIRNVKYETAKLFLDFILSTESGVKEDFENELCKTSFEQIKDSNLLHYFWKNMNLPKCRDILKKLASGENKEYKDNAGNLIDSFYNYLIHEEKIGRQETDDYFLSLIHEENNIIKFIHDMDFFINNIDNDIVRKHFSDVGINTKDIEKTISRIGNDVKYFDVHHWHQDPGIRAQMRSGKEEFIKKRGLFIYELMMRSDISEKLPVAEHKQDGTLKSNQKIIDTEIWDIFTQTLKLKIENGDLKETEIKIISNKEWLSYILVKISDSIEKVKEDNEQQQRLSRLVSILCDFISAVDKVKQNTDELYDVIWDNIYYIPSEFFLQQIPNGNFSLQKIIFHKSKLSEADEDAIWKKTKSAYHIEEDENGNERLVFGENLSEEEKNIIKKKVGYEYVVTKKDGKEEVIFNTDENGKLVKKKYESDPQSFWFWYDIKDFLEQSEVWRRKIKCYTLLSSLDQKYVFCFDLDDINEIIKTNRQEHFYNNFKMLLFWQLKHKFEDTHSGFSKYFQKNTNNLTMADWLIYRLQFLYDDAKDNFCCDLVNLIYKDFDNHPLVEEYSNTKYELINKFMNQISEEYLRNNLLSAENNTLKNIIGTAREKNDTLFSKLSMSYLNKLKYDTQNNNERQNFLNLFSLCSGEIINHVDVNFILDNLDNNCVWENLKFLPEKCPHKNSDGTENENHKKIRLICQNKNFNGLGKLKNRQRSNSVKISSKNNKSYESKAKLWKEDEPKNVINKNKNFCRICKTQEEYWLKLIEFGPKDIIGYLDWRFIYSNLDKKLIQDHLKYINWSIVFNEDNSLKEIMKFIAQEEKFYTQDMEQNLNNTFWQKFKHVKDDSISHYKFLFLLNIYPEAMRNIDISFLAENLLNEDVFDIKFLKRNLFHIGGEDRIKDFFDYIEKSELDPEKKKNKFMMLLDSSLVADVLAYIIYDDDWASIAINELESNFINQQLMSSSGQKIHSLYKHIAELDLQKNKKIEILKMILCRISEEALDYLIAQNIIDRDIVKVFHGTPGHYMLSEGRRCIKVFNYMPNLIEQSLKKFKVQEKKPSQTQDPKNPQENVINDNKNNDNSNIINSNNIIRINLNENQNPSANNFNTVTQIFTGDQQIPITNNKPNNKSNLVPNNKKTRIGLGVIGLIFIIAGICLLFIAPKIAIISLVIGGLLFIGAIGFNKFRSRLCFNKSQIENSEFEQKQSIDERTNNLQAKQMPSNNEINNDNPIV